MKRLSFRTGIISLFAVLTLAATTSSCKKSKTEQATIFQTIASDPQYSLLTAAVVKAGLQDALNQMDMGEKTLFAPSNAAFSAAGFSSASDLASVPADALKNILLYHVLASKVGAADIPQASNTPVTTANGSPIYATRTSGGKVFINGVSVVKADIMCSNGVIHAINRVLMPATGDIVQTAVNNSDFSLLVAAVLRASQGSTDVAAVLSGAGPFTVFAPTNQAFINAGFPDENAINASDPDVLASILTYHVVAGRVFSSDLSDGITPATVNGAQVTINLSGGGATVKGNSNSSASNIVATDILATNGVIHVIDQVLLP